MRHKNNRRQGLIMVELALAMVVMAVGIFAVFTLFGKAMDTGARSRDETEAALFAQSAFNSLRAKSAFAQRTGWWNVFAESFSTGGPGIVVACGGPEGCWIDTNMVLRTDGLQSLVYSNFPLRAASISNVVNQAIRYKLDAVPRSSEPGLTNRIEFTLRVWQGVYGPTNDDLASIFYTEIANTGNL